MPRSCNEIPPDVARAFPTLAGVAAVQTVGGGLSGSRVWRVTATAGDFAVKATPLAAARPEQATWIAGATPRGSVAMAAPETTEAGAPLFVAEGAMWQVRRWIAGARADAARDAHEAVAGLARLHAEWADALERNRPRRSASLVETRLAALDEAACVAGSVVSDLHAAIEAARRSLAEAECPLGEQLIHGDARPANVLIHGGRFSGWIDDGAVGCDSRWRDVARLAGELADGDPQRRRQLVAAYGQLAGVAAPAGLVEALDLTATVVGVLRWRSWLRDGSAPAEGGTDRLQALECRLNRLTRLL